MPDNPFNCKGKYVVYIIECRLCNLRYMGKKKRKKRISGYISDAHKPLLSWPIRNRERRRLEETLHREAFWIFQLNTRFPAGLNYKSDPLLRLFIKIMMPRVIYSLWHSISVCALEVILVLGESFNFSAMTNLANKD